MKTSRTPKTKKLAAALPEVVSAAEWHRAHERFLKKEKAATRARDALAAKRRRLPMTRIEKDYRFAGPKGPASLLDLFEGRQQLILYHFMFGSADEEGCPGCSMVVDNFGHPAHLNARDTSRVLVSRAPLSKLQRYQRRLGWTVPWYSSAGSDFNDDFGVTVEGDEIFGLSVFIRDGDAIYRSYFTNGRGVEALGSNWSYIDLTPWGRQETWEDSPKGRPQSQPYVWWRRHDRYENAAES